MERIEIDNIFKSGLEPTRAFENQNAQWIEVSNRLENDKRRSVAWYMFRLIGLVLIAALAFYISSESPTDLQTQAKVQKEVPELTKAASTANQVNQQKENESILIEKSKGNSKESNNLKSTHRDDDEMTKVIEETSSQSKIGYAQHPITNYEEELQNNQVQSSAANNNISVIQSESAYSNQKTYATNYKESSYSPYSSPALNTENTSIENSKQTDVKDDRSIDFIFPVITTLKPSKLPINGNLDLSNEIITLPNDVQKGKKFAFSISGGGFMEFPISDSIQNVHSTGKTIALSAHYRWIGLTLDYGWSEIQRSTNEEVSNYNIPYQSSIYEPQRPDSASLNYQNKNLQLGLNLTAFKGNWITIDLNSGIAWNKNSKQQAQYRIGTIYGYQYSEAELPEQNWHLSNVYVGNQISFPIYKGLNIYGRYRFLLPLKHDNINWKETHRIGAGLLYKL